MFRNLFFQLFTKGLVIFLVFTANMLYGQLNGNISLGYNRYTNNYNEYIRTNGMIVQYCFDKDMNEYLTLEFGIGTSLAQEVYYYYFYSYSLDNDGNFVQDGGIIERKSNGYSLNFQIPVNLQIKLSERFDLISGISINIDNVFVGRDSNAMNVNPNYTGAETLEDYYLHPWPSTKLLGIGYQLGLAYRLTTKTKLYGEWKSTKNSIFGFHYIELGLKYQVFTNR
ncbi:MAG: hypothetical protein JEY96_19220 [Bacteroidales bacterium]|nr:hypothetical protein [Bacteroidales bacterium]